MMQVLHCQKVFNNSPDNGLNYNLTHTRWLAKDEWLSLAYWIVIKWGISDKSLHVSLESNFHFVILQ